MALEPGDTLLNGQYRIVRLLGRGGFGFVYHAQDTHLAKQVAIKELIPGLVGDERIVKRFLAEARATMELTHERIVRTYHIFPEGGNYYIVMEYMAGGSLEARLQERRPLPVDEAVRLAVQVCEGLSYAHQRGVVHCDLKPANILFASASSERTAASAKLADFGIAHVSGQVLSRSWQTPAGFVAGTLPYMSPEQADGVRDDPRIDLYALGAVLYRALTGQTYLAFDQRETPGAQANNVLRIRNERPSPPSAHRRGIPAWLDGVVLKALAKQPEQRYANAAALRAALLEQKVAVAGPPSAPATAVPVPSQRPRWPAWFWLVIGGTAAILLLVTVLAVVMLSGSEGTTLGTATLEPSRAVVVEATTVLSPALTRTSPPTRMPTPTSILVPTSTAAQMPNQTATPTARPTSVPTKEPVVSVATSTPTSPPPPTRTPVPTTATNPPKPTSAPLQGKIALWLLPRWPNPRGVESGVYVMSLSDGTTNRIMAYCDDPMIHPSGTQLVYAGQPGNPDRGITLVNLATGQHNTLTNTDGDRGPAISWDGDRVAYVSGDAIYILEGGNVRNLVSGNSPTWSPDDNWIAYEHWGALFKIPAWGGQVIKLADLAGSSRSQGNPAWGITGRIAYGSDNDIYVMNADGAGKRRLTDHPAEDYSPAWSPDGTKIVFVSERDGNAELYVMNADGSNLVRLTNTPEWEQSPSWSQ